MTVGHRKGTDGGDRKVANVPLYEPSCGRRSTRSCPVVDLACTAIYAAEAVSIGEGGADDGGRATPQGCPAADDERLRGVPGDPRGRDPRDRRPAGGWAQERGGLDRSRGDAPAEYLRSDVPGSVRAWAMLVGWPSFWTRVGGISWPSPGTASRPSPTCTGRPSRNTWPPTPRRARSSAPR